MRKSKEEPSILHNDFAEKSRTRHGHIAQTRRLNGDAIRDLQTFAGMPRGQAIAMISPKSGSRSRGFKIGDLAL